MIELPRPCGICGVPVENPAFVLIQTTVNLFGFPTFRQEPLCLVCAGKQADAQCQGK